MPYQRTAWLGGLCLAIVAAVGAAHTHEAGKHAHSPGHASHQGPKPPVRISMEELHQLGGVPRGWKFSIPTGDPKAGRDVFVKLECYQCHEIQGEAFPPVTASEPRTGPALTGMGAHHPAEYFAESILTPNATVVTGPGYTDAAGLSIMPDYRESLTVAEWLNLVAYLQSLGGEHAHSGAETPHASHDDHEMLFDQVVGDYRVRVMYHRASTDAHSHGGHSHGPAGQQGAKAPKQDHLMAFVTDTATGEPVPYLPVTLTIPSPKQTARTVKLLPMMGADGFHYGVDIRLPRQPTAVTLSIGATNMRVMPSAAGRFSKAQEVSFTWTPQQPITPVRERPVPQGHGTHGTSKGH